MIMERKAMATEESENVRICNPEKKKKEKHTEKINSRRRVKHVVEKGGRKKKKWKGDHKSISYTMIPDLVKNILKEC